MVLVDLQQPPPWFVQQQAQDHMSLTQARGFAETKGGRTELAFGEGGGVCACVVL
jgi:hypothetical protein